MVQPPPDSTGEPDQPTPASPVPPAEAEGMPAANPAIPVGVPTTDALNHAPATTSEGNTPPARTYAEENASGSSKSWRNSLRWLGGVLGPFAGLVVVILLFAFLTRDVYVGADYGVYIKRDRVYLTRKNFKQIAVHTAIIATCGIGMTMLIIGGGIDLSVGSMVALTTVVVALVFNGAFFATLRDTLFGGQAWLAWTAAFILSGSLVCSSRVQGQSWWRTLLTLLAIWLAGGLIFHQQGGIPAVLAGALAGLACGFVNGAIITSTRVVPFIVTLGTMQVFRGLALLLARQQTVDVDSKILREQYSWLRELTAADPAPTWLESLPGGVAYTVDAVVFGPAVYLMLATGLAVYILLTRLRLGRYCFAVGSNEQAALLSGLPVGNIKLWMYSLAGLTTGLAGVMQFSEISSGVPTEASGLELDVIAAVVIGGGSLRGGEGSIIGTFIGAFIMGFMRNGCFSANIAPAVTQVLIGALIILAVTVDELRHRRQT